jgi:transcription initiation factor TFIIIB Brf1 subunit/transcription initiation factor TFIIB
MMDPCTDLGSIWNDMLESKNLEKKEKKEDTCNCKHLNTFEDSSTHDTVCSDCCEIIERCVYSGAEWNNYKTETGCWAFSQQRGETFVSDNPYQRGESSIIQYKNPLLMRMQYQLAFNHKQKTYWQTGLTFDHVSTILNLKKDCTDTAKNLWHNCMESGKLTRASVREGLIASCLYYSCIYNSCPISREEISNAFKCTSKCLAKGEKVFYQVIENSKDYKHLMNTNIDIHENDSFVKYCSKLGVPFKVSNQCNEIYEKYKLELQVVTPKSATGGILTHVIKNVLKMKSPSKSEISKVVNVCTPTINKVLEIIKNID